MYRQFMMHGQKKIKLYYIKLFYFGLS